MKTSKKQHSINITTKTSEEDIMANSSTNSPTQTTPLTKENKVETKEVEKNAAAESMSPATAAKEVKKAKKVAAKYYASLGEKFRKILAKCHELQEEIETIDNTLKSKEIVIDPAEKGGTKITRKATPAEIAGLRNQQAKKKAELTVSNKALKSLSNRFTSISRRNTAATKAQVTRFNINSKLTNKARKSADEIDEMSDSTVDMLVSNGDPRLENIKNVFGQHPSKASSLFYGILKVEWAGKKVGKENALDLLAASPSTRSRLAKRVAIRFSK